MNVANLQLEGLIMAVAAVNRTLVKRGVLTPEDIARALEQAEAGLTGEARLSEDMSLANRDAICFPIRLLMHANAAEENVTFSDLTREVGRTKRPYGDQM